MTTDIDYGFFEPKTDFQRKFVAPIFFSRVKITDTTRLYYYPGAFGTFHEGHLGVVREVYNQASKQGTDFIIVIAPAHADYNAEKYGQWSIFASNYHRIQAIRNAIINDPSGLVNHCVIDLMPMLGQDSDQNFTDLGLHFAHRVLDTNEVTFVFGKDRESYAKISDVLPCTGSLYVKGTGHSTSSLVNEQRSKKNVHVRAWNERQVDLFRDYFDDYFASITFRSIPEEIEEVEKIRKNCENPFTICKDYKNVLPYYPLHRAWVNPYEHSGYIHGKLPSYGTVIDSDVYSGSTRKYIKELSSNYSFVATMECDPIHDEIIDIDDFLSNALIDYSFRMSFPAVTTEIHAKIESFTESLLQTL